MGEEDFKSYQLVHTTAIPVQIFAYKVRHCNDFDFFFLEMALNDSAGSQTWNQTITCSPRISTGVCSL